MGHSCILQEFLSVLVIQRQQRTRSQIAEEQRHPEPANGRRDHDIEQCQRTNEDRL